MKILLTLLCLSASSYASVVKRPPYIPDENHHPPATPNLRQAQEDKSEVIKAKEATPIKKRHKKELNKLKAEENAK